MPNPKTGFSQCAFFTNRGPNATLSYPQVAFIDEYNLIDWHQHFLIGEACEMLCVARVLYGDSGKSAPIRSKNDNAEMIGLRCALTIQFMDNKRITQASEALRELLSDQIWNWRSNNDNANVNNYVRKLLHRYLDDRVNPHVVLRGLDSWFSAICRLLNWYDNKPCRRHLATISDICQLLNLLPALSLPCIIALRNRSGDRSNYWLSRAICDYVTTRCAAAASEPTQSNQVADNYCIVVRRSVHANLKAYEAHTGIIESQGPGRRDVPGMIDDDPWCADLTLILGAVYRFIGSSKLLQRDTLLQLVAFLPEHDNSQTPPYRCDSFSCSHCDQTRGRRGKWQRANSRLTLGCGAPEPLHAFEEGLLADNLSEAPAKARYAARRVPRLLMRRVYSDTLTARPNYVDCSEETYGYRLPNWQKNDDEDNPPVLRKVVQNSGDIDPLYIITRAYYTLTRCSSVWTASPHATAGTARHGMRLYGYPLVLNAAVTSYRVQGETIAASDVYIDFARMGKEQALVALSRVRRFEQICGVINIDKFGR